MNFNSLIFISLPIILLSTNCADNSENKTLPIQTDSIIAVPVKTDIETVPQLDSISQLDNKQTFLDCLKPKYFLKKRIDKDEYGKIELVYLGVITNDNADTLYYVVTEYKELKMAIQTKASSFLYYFSYDKQFYKQYEPDILPFKLEKNQFSFNQVDSLNKKTIYVNNVGTKLPDYLQTAPDN